MIVYSNFLLRPEETNDQTHLATCVRHITATLIGRHPAYDALCHHELPGHRVTQADVSYFQPARVHRIVHCQRPLRDPYC